MGIFGKAKGARPSEGGSYFPAGVYAVMINQIKKGETQQDVEYCAVETFVVESDNEKLKPGMPSSMMVMGNWKGAGSILVDLGIAMGEALTGEKPEAADIDEAGLEALAGKDQPAAGVFIGLRVLPPKPGKQFHPHRWFQLDAAAMKRVKAAAEKLGIKVQQAA